MEKTKPEEFTEEKFRGIVVNLAIKYYRIFPNHVRAWVDLEDLIQDCLMHLRASVIPNYNSRSASMSTFIHWGTENYLRDRYRHHTTAKRHTEKEILSIPYDGQIFLQKDGSFYAPQAPASSHLAYLEAAEAMRFVFSRSSMALKEELRHVFREDRSLRRTVTDKKLLKEFRNLVSRANLRITDFQLLLQNEFVL